MGRLLVFALLTITLGCATSPDEQQREATSKEDRFEFELTPIDWENCTNCISCPGEPERDARCVPVRQSLTNVQMFKGFKCFSIKSGGIFANAGLQDGDVLLEADGIILNRTEKMIRFTEQLRKNNVSKIQISRDGVDLTLNLK